MLVLYLWLERILWKVIILCLLFGSLILIIDCSGIVDICVDKVVIECVMLLVSLIIWFVFKSGVGLSLYIVIIGSGCIEMILFFML